MSADKFKFRTEVSIQKPSFAITLNSNTLLAGSCFADMIGDKMRLNKLNCLTNPFGNIYNPISLLRLLKLSLHNNLPEDWTFIENQGRWVNYLFHSEIVGKTKEELSEKIEKVISEVGEFLKKSDFLILTLGTSWVYKLIEGNDIVANCHKIPAQNFTKYLLSPKEIIDEYELWRNEIISINPNLKIIFTVSPVRHVKDTLPLNNLSKSILRTSIHYINESFPETSYFPSYEIMVDDLRDYRFYKNDLIHPTEMAEEYIWSKFSDAYLDQKTLEFINEWDKLSKAIAHKPFHPESDQHQKFLTEKLKKLLILNEKIDLSEEIELLKRRII